MAKARSINTALLHKIRATPCVICGVPYNIHCDHIIPVCKGGSSAEQNLQPLCRDCNWIKGSRLTNRQVAEEIARRGEYHFLYAIYRWDTRSESCYGGTDFVQWRYKKPERAKFGADLHANFISRIGAIT